MDFMSIFLSLAILRPPFAYFSVHFYEFMPSDVVLPADFSVQERNQFVELSCYDELKNEFKKHMLCDFGLNEELNMD